MNSTGYVEKALRDVKGPSLVLKSNLALTAPKQAAMDIWSNALTEARAETKNELDLAGA